MPSLPTDAWPALCTLLALALLLILIIGFRIHAFVALLVASLALGLAAGQQPDKVIVSVRNGVGEVLKGVAVVLALGALLGRILDVSGAAEVIARTLIRAFGSARASLAILAAAYLIGIPILFNVGFLLLIPIAWRLQRETGRSLLWFVLPLCFSLSTTHSLVPPHPGIVGAVNVLGAHLKTEAQGTLMIQTILFGAVMGVPVVLVGWLGPGRWWAGHQHVAAPPHLAGEETPPVAVAVEERPLPSFRLSLLIVVLPLLMSVVGFSVDLLAGIGQTPAWLSQPVLPGVLEHTPTSWLRFLGTPEMALLVPTGLAFLLLGVGRGMDRAALAKLAGRAVQDVGEMAFLFGAAGGFMQVIKDTKAGDWIAGQLLDLPLSPVASAYLVAVLMRIALGSATASILTASALLAGLARSLPGQETLLVLAVANGVTFMTQPADSGFWLVKEYCNLGVRDVLLRFNACRIVMSLTGLALLLAYEACFS
jgi:Gnt-I system low-affinity gluconate transporter